jgi:dTMP kinase
MFVILEGIDGSGKSTLHNILKVKLPQYEYLPEIVFTREPGGTKFGENLRNILLSEEITPTTTFLLMQAARIEHINTVIKPALQKGKIVISDRYYPSSIAYQGAQGVPKQFMFSVLNGSKTIMPDMCFFLNISIEKAQQRKEKDNFFDKKSIEFYEKVSNNYLSSVNMAWGKTFFLDVSNLSMKEVSDNFIENFMDYYHKYIKDKPYSLKQ